MSKYLSIITLNINGLNAPIKRHTIAERHTQTENEGLETNIPSKLTGKKSGGKKTHIGQNRLQTQGHKKRTRRSLHNTPGKNRSQRHKHCKYICTQNKSRQIHQENLGGLQERY